MTKKRILFIHENYPAQFGALGQYMAEQGWDVMFATAAKGIAQDEVKRVGDVRVAGYRAHREPHESTHNYLRVTEKAILNGQGFARLAVKLRNSGFTPDIVMAHSGWGSGTFTKAIWPETKFIQYLEWWYEHPARDSVTQEQDEVQAENKRAKTFSRNLPFLLDWAYADGLLVPTQFQADGVPEKMRDGMLVMHDGVDTEMFSPQPDVDLSFLKSAPPPDVPVITYATRGMEPYRGFTQFMEALS